MADDAAKALKLAEANEKQINLLWKALARYEKAQNAWEKTQTKYIEDVDNSLRDYVKAVEKANLDFEKAQMKYIQDMEKNLIEAHDKQDKKFVDAFNDLKKWIDKTFDKKGLFN